MTTFNALKNHMKLVGVLRSHSTDRDRIVFKISGYLTLATFIQYWITINWFLIFEAQTFLEYAESATNVLTASMCLLWYYMMFRQQKDTIECFTRLDALIEKSKAEIIQFVVQLVDEFAANTLLVKFAIDHRKQNKCCFKSDIRDSKPES